MDKKWPIIGAAAIVVVAVVLFVVLTEFNPFGRSRPWGRMGGGEFFDSNAMFDRLKEPLGLPADATKEDVMNELGLPADATPEQVMQALREKGIDFRRRE